MGRRRQVTVPAVAGYGRHWRCCRRAWVVIGAALLVVCALSVGGRPVAAQTPADPDAVATDRTPLPDGDASDRPAARGAVSTIDFVRMVVVLAAVLGAIYLLLRLLRRGAGARMGGNGRIDLLASRSLGGSRSLHLVRVGRDFLLVGAADQAVNLVARITDSESIDALQVSLDGDAGAPRGRFTDLLADAGIGSAESRRTAAASGTGDAGQGDVAGAARFLRRQRDRLRDLRHHAAPGEGVRAAR